MTCPRDEPGPDGEDLLTVFADGLRQSYTLGPPPRVGPALAEVLAAGTRRAAADGPVPVAAPERTAGGFLDRLQGRRPRLALGAVVASLTFLGVGAAGALPGPAQSAFDRSADAVGVTLPAAGARGSTAPGAHEPEDLPGSFSSGAQDEEGAGAGPTVPPAGDSQGAAVPDDTAAAGASLAGPAGDVQERRGNAGGRPGQTHAEPSPADDRPALVPEPGRQPDGNGGPRPGVDFRGGTGSEDRAGVGRGRGFNWHRPWWASSREQPAGPAAGSELGREAGSAEESPERAYPSPPTRR